MAGVVGVTSRWSRIFFYSFYFIAVMCIMNLIVAAFVDTFLAQDRTVDDDGGMMNIERRRSKIDMNTKHTPISLMNRTKSEVKSRANEQPTVSSPIWQQLSQKKRSRTRE